MKGAGWGDGVMDCAFLDMCVYGSMLHLCCGIRTSISPEDIDGMHVLMNGDEGEGGFLGGLRNVCIKRYLVLQLIPQRRGRRQYYVPLSFSYSFPLVWINMTR